MLKRFKSQSEFNKNILTLMTGTSIAQAIPIAISPILTRIFTPSDFGLFALYISISGMIAIVSTGRYELAMMLPKEDDDALHLVFLSLIISLVISFICLLLVFVFNSELTSFLKNESISTWLYFIPLTILLSGAYQSLYYWNNRQKKFKNLSISKIVQTSTTVTTNLGLGYLIAGPVGLVLGNVLGQFSSVFYFAKSFIKSIRNKNICYSRIKKIAHRYRKFPQFDAPSALLNMASSHSVHIFFNIFFGAVSSGYYFLVQKVFGLPLMLIAASVQDVFKEEVARVHKMEGNTRKIFIETFFKLAKLSIIPAILIYFFAIDFFVFFFGEKWGAAGVYVQILTPVFLIRFISFPLSFMFYIAEKQHINIIGQFVQFLSVVIVMVIGHNHNPIYTVQLLSVISSIFYLVYIILSYHFTSTGKKQSN